MHDHSSPIYAGTLHIYNGCKTSLRREFVTADVVRQYGRKYYLSYLRYDLAVCPQMKSFRECRVRYVR